MKDEKGLMVEIGDRPDAQAEPAPTGGNTDTVPLDLLSMPDDQEQMQPPAVGDEVNYQVAGKVVSISGNVATIERTSINGQELPDADEGDEGAEKPGAADDDAEAQGLRSQADGMGMSL